MHRFKSILAVLSEDSLAEVAWDRAVHLARAGRAALTLVDVIDAAPGELGRLIAALSGQRGAEIEDDVIAYHRERLAAFADRARAEGVEVTEAVLQGSPAVEVIRMVLREGHDVVIKGASVAAAGRGRLGGDDMHLLRKCPCPVWILTGTGDGRFDKILAAIDPEATGDPARDRLDRQVLDLATALGEHDAAQVHVIHAWSLQEERALRHGPYTKGSKGDVDTLVDREEAAARARVMGLMAQYPQVPARRIRLHKGCPDAVIADYAETGKIDAIVMGTVGRTGRSDCVMGTTAETILGRVRCSVIAVKPEGFVSPVTLETGG